MLSFKSGKPIARIEGGEHDKKTLYIFDKERDQKACCKKCSSKCEKKKCCRKCEYDGGKCCPNVSDSDSEDEIFELDPSDYISESFLKKHGRKMNIIEMEKIMKSLKEKTPYRGNNEDVYDNAKSILDKKASTELIIKEGKLVPLPSDNEVQGERVYVAGPSGSGKSTYSANYIKEYQKIFPENEFVLFSRVQEDEVLDKLKPLRIKIDQNLIDEPLEPKDFENSIVLFDDIDTIPDKKVARAVQSLRDDLLETGRHECTYVVSCSHQITNYKHTKTILNESQGVTFFPKAGSWNGIKYFLTVYCGLDKKTIDMIKKLNSRWVTVYKTYPMYCIYEKGAFLLNNM